MEWVSKLPDTYYVLIYFESNVIIFKLKIIGILSCNKCGYNLCFLKGRETPSPGETPYMCRQRNSLARSTGSIGGTEQQEVNEMERGHLLSLPASHHSVQLPHSHVNTPVV